MAAQTSSTTAAASTPAASLVQRACALAATILQAATASLQTREAELRQTAARAAAQASSFAAEEADVRQELAALQRRQQSSGVRESAAQRSHRVGLEMRLQLLAPAVQPLREAATRTDPILSGMQQDVHLMQRQVKQHGTRGGLAEPSLLSLLLRAANSFKLPDGPKSQRTLLEVAHVLPQLLAHTSAFELRRDQVPMLLLRAGAFDLLPQAIQRAQADMPERAALTPAPTAPHSHTFQEVLYARLLWCCRSDEGHMEEQLGLAALAAAGSLDLTHSGTIHVVLQLLRDWPASASRSVQEPTELQHAIDTAPRSIVHLQPAAPRQADTQLQRELPRRRHRFLSALRHSWRRYSEAVYAQLSPHVEAVATALVGAYAGLDSYTGPYAENASCAVDVHFDVTAELRRVHELCCEGSHALSTEYASMALLEHVPDLPAVCNNLACLWLQCAQQLSCRSPGQESRPHGAHSSRAATAEAAASAFMYALVAAALLRRSDATSTCAGKAWFRAASALESMQEWSAACTCAEIAVPLDEGLSSQQLLRRARHALATSPGPPARQGLAQVIALMISKAPTMPSAAAPGDDGASSELRLLEVNELKERGNALMRQRRFLDARLQYEQALRHLRPCADLLAALASCSLHLRKRGAGQDTLEDCLLFAQGALVLQPTLLEALYTRAVALRTLGVSARAASKRAADEASQAASRINPIVSSDQTKTDWRAKIAELALPIPQVPAPIQPDQRYSREKLDTMDERELLQATAEAITPARVLQVREQNEAEVAGARAHGLPSPIDSRMPQLHIEFEQHCKTAGWPVGVAPLHLRTLLELAFEEARVLPAHEPPTPYLVPEDEDEEKQIWQLLMHRLGSVAPQIMEWWVAAKPGEQISLLELFDKRQVRQMRYTQRSVHSYSNFLSWPLQLRRGTTHVAVGFVDLGQLRTCQLLPALEPNEESKQESPPEQLTPASTAQRPVPPQPPLRWIGYEQVGATVAKSEVLLRMLRRPRSASDAAENQLEDEVLQVWYSATWSPSTLTAFRQALQQTLDERSRPEAEAAAPLHSDVRKVLEWWAAAESRDVGRARLPFLQDVQFMTWLGNFAQLPDRLAMMRYGATRDLFPANTDWHASLTMFHLPAGLNCTPRESVLNVVPLNELLRLRSQHPDVLSAARDYLRAGVRRARELLLSGAVEVELRVGTVEMGSAAAHEVAVLHPASVSWSNVCDYMLPGDFHRLLRSVSSAAPKGLSVEAGATQEQASTVHTFYTMNWMKGIKGAFYIDYAKESSRKLLLERCLARHDAFRQQQPPLYAQLLLHPPIDNRWNVCTWPLAMHYYRAWLERFCSLDGKSAQLPASLLQRVHVLHPPYNYIFGRNAVTLGLQLSYPKL